MRHTLGAGTPFAFDLLASPALIRSAEPTPALAGFRALGALEDPARQIRVAALGAPLTSDVLPGDWIELTFPSLHFSAQADVLGAPGHLIAERAGTDGERWVHVVAHRIGRILVALYASLPRNQAEPTAGELAATLGSFYIHHAVPGMLTAYAPRQFHDVTLLCPPQSTVTQQAGQWQVQRGRSWLSLQVTPLRTAAAGDPKQALREAVSAARAAGLQLDPKGATPVVHRGPLMSQFTTGPVLQSAPAQWEGQPVECTWSAGRLGDTLLTLWARYPSRELDPPAWCSARADLFTALAGAQRAATSTQPEVSP